VTTVTGAQTPAMREQNSLSVTTGVHLSETNMMNMMLSRRPDRVKRTH
jgi:hypothetical protein